MRRNLGFTAIALAALAIGIGANTAIFTVVDAVLLQPLPYPQPDRIMKVGRQYPTGTGDSNSIPKYMVWRKNDVFEAMALYDFGAIAMNLGSGNPPRPRQGRPHLGGLLQGVRRVADGRAELLRSRGPPARAGGGHHRLRIVAVALRRRQRRARPAASAERHAVYRSSASCRTDSRPIPKRISGFRCRPIRTARIRVITCSRPAG